MVDVNNNIFSDMEIDAIGEILNISFGSSATALSNMLDKRVDITVPAVELLRIDDFEFTSMEPAVGVEITYVEGLDGANIMILKRTDVKSIVEILMQTEIPEDEFELNELNMSAICEVMNQMMGASATALSEFLGEVVNITTPISFEVDDANEFKSKYFSAEDPMVVVRFQLKIEELVESEFLVLLNIDLAKRILSGFSFGADELLDEQPAVAPVPEAAPIPEAPMAPSPSMGQMPETAPSMPDMAQMQPNMGMNQMPQAAQGMPMGQPQMQPNMAMNQMPYMGMPYMQPDMNQMPPGVQAIPYMQQQQPKLINVQQPINQSFDAEMAALSVEQKSNLNLILDVPLQVSVEIGRTRKNVKDILEFSQGTLIILDKLAGEPVDLCVNGQCIAKGDVVVVDDSFGIRITEIIKKPSSLLSN